MIAERSERLDLEMECLDRRRRGLTALKDALLHADAGVVDRAVEASLQLPSVTGCDDAASLAASAPPEALTAAVGQLRARLADVAALAGVGRFTDAAAGAAELLARAEAIGFRPLIAEVALLAGTIAIERGSADEAEHLLSIALRDGIEGRVDRVVAEAVARRLYVRGVLSNAPAEARSDEELAAAYLLRFPDDGALRWLLEINLGASADRRGDSDRARDHYERALAVADGPTELDRARTRINLGITAYEALDFEAALHHDQEAVAGAARVLGDDHPLVAQLRMYEAFALEALGRRAEARARLEAIVAGADVDGGDPRLLAWPRIRLARLDAHRRSYAAGRAQAEAALAAADPGDTHTRLYAASAAADTRVDADACLEAERRVVADAERIFGVDDDDTTTLRQYASVALLRRGRPAEAVAWAREAVAARAARRGPEHPLHAEALRILAEALLTAGEPSEASERAAAAITTLARHRVELPLDRALAERAYGEALLRLGEADPAIATLRGALDRLAPRLDADDPDRARTELLLAEALVAGGDPKGEATAHLDQAATIYRGLGDAFASELAEVDRIRRRE